MYTVDFPLPVPELGKGEFGDCDNVFHQNSELTVLEIV